MNSGCRAISDSGRPGFCARSSRGIGGGDLSCVSTRPASAASIDCAMKVAANRCGSHQSLVTITTADPTTPAITPPASTNEIALGL